jgi:hypothetical protein
VIPISAGVLDSPFGVRWTTLTMAAVILLLIGVVRRRPDLAVVAVLAWAGGFETVFTATGNLRWHPTTGWNEMTWRGVALAGWVLLAPVAGIRVSRAWLAATAALFAIWLTPIPGLTYGLEYNLPQTADGAAQPIRVLPELENVATKTAWGMMYLVGAWRAQSVPVWHRLRRGAQGTWRETGPGRGASGFGGTGPSGT